MFSYVPNTVGPNRPKLSRGKSHSTCSSLAMTRDNNPRRRVTTYDYHC
jgi:hypothetical protein